MEEAETVDVVGRPRRMGAIASKTVWRAWAAEVTFVVGMEGGRKLTTSLMLDNLDSCSDGRSDGGDGMSYDLGQYTRRMQCNYRLTYR
jgi:hypothetical protein